METYEKLESLLQGKSIVTNIDTGVIYPQIQNNPASVYSFLLVTGYLKTITNDQTFGGDYICEVALPNKEISYVYSKEILSKFENMIPQSTASAIQTAIYTMDISKPKELLENFLLQTVSFHDAANETFYHGLILGLCAIFNSRYQVSSNREAGNGRFDICMIPFNKRLPGILMELKAGKDCTENQLSELAEAALLQINTKKYYADMGTWKVTSVLQYGIAFPGKNVCIKGEERKL